MVAYTFSWGWFAFGAIMMALSAAVVFFFQPLADNLGDGVGDYDKYRKYGLIGVAVGFLVMVNVHSLLLSWFFSLVFGGIMGANSAY